MTDGFDKWINSMDEDEFVDRIESSADNGGFTDRQRPIALNLREPIEESELEQMEREQQGPTMLQPEQRVYDTRDISIQSKTFVNAQGDVITSINKANDAEQIQRDREQSIRSEQIRKQSFIQRIKSSVLRVFGRK